MLNFSQGLLCNLKFAILFWYSIQACIQRVIPGAVVQQYLRKTLVMNSKVFRGNTSQELIVFSRNGKIVEREENTSRVRGRIPQSHRCVTTSMCYYIDVLPHRCVTTSTCYHIDVLPHRRVTTSTCYHIDV